MPVTHRAAKITPRTYMAGTKTPAAMTRACSTVPAQSVQPMPGRPTTPLSTRANGQAAADTGRDAAVQVLEDDGGRDGEPDDDGFHGQDRAAQLPQLLHDSSAAVNEWREGWTDGGSAGIAAVRREQDAGIPRGDHRPRDQYTAAPGSCPQASSASPTAVSIASSSRSADRTRSSPKISMASSAVSSGSRAQLRN